MEELTCGDAASNPSASSATNEDVIGKPQPLEQPEQIGDEGAESAPTDVSLADEGTSAPQQAKTTIKLDDVVIDDSIYPRESVDSSVVDQYVETIRSGEADRFPPIVLEEGTNRLLDGVHRFEAFKKYRAKVATYLAHTVEAAGESEGLHDDDVPSPSDEIACRYAKVPEGVPSMLFAYSFNKNHGLRPSAKDRKKATRHAYENNPGIPLETLAKYLGVSRKTVSTDVEDLRAEFETEKKTFIHRRYFIENATEEEITKELAEKYPGAKGISQSTVARTIEELDKKHSERREQKKTKVSAGSSPETESDMEVLYPPAPSDEVPPSTKHEETVTKTGFPDTSGSRTSERGQPKVTTASETDKLPIVEVNSELPTTGEADDPDLQKMESLQLSAYPSDVWALKDGSKKPLPWYLKFERDRSGLRIPTEAAANMIYRFSAPSELVLDPLGHSDPLGDLCDSMNRDYLPINSQNEDWPEEASRAALVSVNPRSIDDDPAMDPNNHLAALERVLTRAFQVVEPGTTLAMLAEEWIAGDETVLIYDYTDLIRSAGWTPVRCIQLVDLESELDPKIVDKFRKNRGSLLTQARYLLVGKKEHTAGATPTDEEERLFSNSAPKLVEIASTSELDSVAPADSHEELE